MLCPSKNFMVNTDRPAEPVDYLHSSPERNMYFLLLLLDRIEICRWTKKDIFLILNVVRPQITMAITIIITKIVFFSLNFVGTS